MRKIFLASVVFFSAISALCYADVPPVTYAVWMAINAVDPSGRWLRFQNNAVDVWGLGVSGADTLFLSRYIGGVFQDYTLLIDDATGTATFNNGVIAHGPLTTNAGLDLERTWVLSGPSSDLTNSALFTNLNISGPAPSNGHVGQWGITTDTVASPDVYSGFSFLHQFGGAAMTGGRVVAKAFGALTSPSGNTAASGQEGGYLAFAADMSVGADTGTGLTINTARSAVWGANVVATLGDNAANYRSIAGQETNIQIYPTASVTQGVGEAVILENANGKQAQGTWAGFAVGAQEAPIGMFKTGYQIGLPAGKFPVDQYGVGLGVYPSQADFPSNPARMAWFLDGLAGTYSGGLLRGPNYRVSGDGTTQIGTGVVAPTASGLSVDAAGSIATAVAVVNGGTNGRENAYYTDAYGGFYYVPAGGVSGGAVTSLVMYRAPMIPSGAPPANPITLTADGASGLYYGVSSTITVNLTWAQKTTLALSPSGGRTTIGGSLQLTPSTPASSSAACTAGQIATDASYIYACTSTNTWKRAALSAF